MQEVVRFGYAPALPRALRRPVADMLIKCIFNRHFVQEPAALNLRRFARVAHVNLGEEEIAPLTMIGD